MFTSPLRYPGGKSKLTEFVAHTIEINNIKNPIYCEPFCGGAGVAMNLLLSSRVDKIVLNDYDVAIYSFWKAVVDDTSKLIKKILNTEITMVEREKQKEIYKLKKDIRNYDIDLAFATLFLNRTSVSGIIKGGVIGGQKQSGQYKIDARFNKENIIEKITTIAKYSSKIELFNLEANKFIKDFLMRMDKSQTFIFFDPPYYKQGKNLYTNFFIHDDHKKLFESIKLLDDFHWIMTYDNEDEIYQIYKDYSPKKYSLRYSAKNKIKAFELFFKSHKTLVNSFDKVAFEKV